MAGLAALLLLTQPLGWAGTTEPIPEASEAWELHLVLSSHTDSVNALSFAPDGETLISGGQDGAIFFWDPEDGYANARLSGRSGPIQRLFLSSAGSTLAYNDGEGWTLWDLDRWEGARGGYAAAGACYFSRISEPGSMLPEGKISLLDAATGREREPKKQNIRQIPTIAPPLEALGARYSAKWLGPP